MTRHLPGIACRSFHLSLGRHANRNCVIAKPEPVWSDRHIHCDGQRLRRHADGHGDVQRWRHGDRDAQPCREALRRFAISTLAIGNHTITASYGGSADFAASMSPALAQTVNVPPDSVKLRTLQINVTKVVAQGSGQAISGAIDNAISEGFSDGGTFVTPGGGGMHFNFAADPGIDDAPVSGAADGSSAYSSDGSAAVPSGRPAARRGSRVDHAFAALDQQMPKQGALPKWREEQQWLLWVDVRGTGVDRWGTSNARRAHHAGHALRPAGQCLDRADLQGRRRIS